MGTGIRRGRPSSSAAIPKSSSLIYSPASRGALIAVILKLPHQRLDLVLMVRKAQGCMQHVEIIERKPLYNGLGFAGREYEVEEPKEKVRRHIILYNGIHGVLPAVALLTLQYLPKPSTSVLGIDIGTSSVKVVQLRRERGRVVLETYGAIALGPMPTSR
jgi:hypothetical protein